MRQLWEVVDFMRRVRRRMRFGRISRAPLQPLRLELYGGFLEYDWMVRPADIWDWDPSVSNLDRERNESQQALRDAIAMRDLLFASLPSVKSAVLSAFRPSVAREPPDLVIRGYADREATTAVRVSSLAMKAKLYGFQFYLEDGVLLALTTEKYKKSTVLHDMHLDRVTL